MANNSNVEQTDFDDGMRPLTPEERTRLRELLAQQPTAEERASLRELLAHQENIIEAGNIVAHSTWFGMMFFKTITFITAIIAFVGAILTIKTWGVWK